ncbi:hypothetical protein SEA_FAITH5X5_25 [Gordonia phage Faith5x5]|nr:hypothetical protein SEA_FAITH5X5_25 [Gordonia phage Faith5x5]
MPTITYTLDDGFGTPGKKLKLKWQPATIRTHDGALVVGGPPKEVFSTVGTSTTIEGIASGMWAISNFGVAGGHRTAYIDVDEVGGDVTALIEAAVALPQNAPVTDVIAAAKAAAEVAVGGLDVLTQEDADAAYAPVWKASTVYALGAKVVSPLTGDVIRRLTAGTSRESFDTTEQALWLAAYGTVTRTVAAVDTPMPFRARADYLCDGTADLATIQQALDALPDDNAVSGEIVLLAGNYSDATNATLSVGSPSSATLNPRKVLRFERGARINVSGRTGRKAVVKVESPDCQIINPNIAGNAAFGNGTGISIGGDVATLGGFWGKVANRVLIYEPILSNLETGLEFASIDGGPGVGGSTGDCKVHGGYIFQCKTGIRAAGYTNTMYAPTLANNNKAIWVEARRSEAQLRVHDPAIVGWNEVGILVEGGFGSVFSNTWMEQNPASASTATEAIRLGQSGTVRANATKFTGTTHVQLVNEQYAIKYVGAIGTEVEELVLSTSGAVPSVAVARNEMQSTSKNNRIRRYTFGPNAIPSHTSLSIDAAAWGELFIDRVSGLVGADGFSTRRNPSTRASSTPVARKLTDSSKTSDATMGSDTELTVNLNPGTVYALDGIIFFDAGQTGDFKMALSVSGTNSTISWVGVGPASSHTNAVGVSSVTTQRATSGFVMTWGGAAAGTVIGVPIKGVVSVTELATITMTWAQAVADATPTILKAGSYLELTPIS